MPPFQVVFYATAIRTSGPAAPLRLGQDYRAGDGERREDHEVTVHLGEAGDEAHFDS
jgi:hypothetical protein